MSLDRILIANRSEIAMRVTRTIADRGGKSILPYTAEDLTAPATALADEAYALPAGSGYTDAQAILELAKSTGAQAIHPGYGFLAENVEFAKAVIEAGITWIGPSPEAMEALGDKMSARQVAESAGVDPVPGITDAVTEASVVKEFAARYGYPVALKRTDGGGGRGITVLYSDDEVDTTPALDEFQSATPGTAGGTVTQILEKFITHARHVETQCARDAFGNFAVVSTRDCTLQRRNQKLLEEAPAPFLPADIEHKLVENSRRLFEAVNYVGVGTCEFLYTDEGDLWFLEVNPRLQVEHCVSEEVSGTDLVDIQLRLAEGQRLPQLETAQGHSIELRITCEDPARALAPTTGTITAVHWPAGHGVRVESGIAVGDEVTPFFDPMLAKLVITGPTRQAAIARALRALRETSIEGLATCLSAHEAALKSPAFTAVVDGHEAAENYTVTTRWIENELLPTLIDEEAQAEATSGAASAPVQRREVIIEVDGRRVKLGVPADLFTATAIAVPVEGPLGTSAPVSSITQPLRAGRGSRAGHTAVQEVSDGCVTAPIQAIVTRIAVEDGQQVEEGELLVVLESMKMENYVRAPHAGVVELVGVATGATVSAGDVLLNLHKEDQ